MKCLKTGDTILIESPYAYAVRNSCFDTNCAYCLTEGHLHKCLGCHVLRYCSKICQKKGWSEHKWECKNLQKVDIKYQSNISGTGLLVCRILYKIINNNYGSSVKSFVNNNLQFPPTRNFEELVAHKDEHMKDSEQMDSFTSYIKTINMLLPKDMFEKHFSKIFEIYCKIGINGISICGKVLLPVASALYIKASYFNHSCHSNTNVIFNGSDIIISLTEDVYIDENENFQDKIFINYGAQLDSYKNRQRILYEKYYFKCHCKLCESRDTLGEYDLSAFPPELRCTGGDQQDIEAIQIPMFTRLIEKLSLRFAGLDLKTLRKAVKHNPFPTSTNVLYNKCLIETIEANHINGIFDEPTMLLALYHLGIAFKNGNALNTYYEYNSVTCVNHLLMLVKLARYFNDPAAKSYLNEAQNIYNTALSPKSLDGMPLDLHNDCVLKSQRDFLDRFQRELS